MRNMMVREGGGGRGQAGLWCGYLKRRLLDWESGCRRSSSSYLNLTLVRIRKYDTVYGLSLDVGEEPAAKTSKKK